MGDTWNSEQNIAHHVPCIDHCIIISTINISLLIYLQGKWNTLRKKYNLEGSMVGNHWLIRLFFLLQISRNFIIRLLLSFKV